MAERRMMTRKVTDDDKFMALSSSAQALYLHLMMSADDDGFSNQVTISMFRAHASVQDLAALLEARFLYQFEDGVIVIRHWRMANAIRKDRYTPTVFQKDMKALKIDADGVYHQGDGNQLATTWQPDGNQVATNRQPSIGKDRIGKDKKVKGEGSRRFAPPSLEEVKSYCQERNNGIDPETFIDFYTAKGWKVGKDPMKDWKAAVRTWEKRDDRPGASPARPAKKNSFNNLPEDRESANASWGGLQPFHAGTVEDLPFYEPAEEPELVDEDEEWMKKVANSAAARRWGA